MSRPILFDVTHLVTRLTNPIPSGIERVDLSYGRHFAQDPSREVAGIHYSFVGSGLMAPARLRDLMGAVDKAWSEKSGGDADANFAAVAAWLKAPRGEAGRPTRIRANPQKADVRLRRGVGQLTYRFAPDYLGRAAENAIYLNIAQHSLYQPAYFRWLADYPRMAKVFMMHDLLPLEYPEYFRAGYRKRFDACVATIARHATAVLTQTEAVASRIRREMARRNRPDMRVEVIPLPSPLADIAPDSLTDPELAASNYFIIVSTIEPRKNHLLLLNVWREMAQRMKNPPRLVLVGGRGWDNEQVLDMLDRCEPLRPLVIEAAGLSERGLARLVANARALLMPTFAEGYGLPIMEALTLGTPVIGSQIDVFEEIARDSATLLSPLDGIGWAEAIEAHLEDNACFRTAAKGFQPPRWADYFDAVEQFLESLPA